MVFNYLSYQPSTTDLSRDDTIRSGLGRPTPVINQGNPHRHTSVEVFPFPAVLRLAIKYVSQFDKGEGLIYLQCNHKASTSVPCLLCPSLDVWVLGGVIPGSFPGPAGHLHVIFRGPGLSVASLLGIPNPLMLQQDTVVSSVRAHSRISQFIYRRHQHVWGGTEESPPLWRRF